MLVEALVLGGDHRVLEHLGNVFRLYRDGQLEVAELANLAAAGVVDEARPGHERRVLRRQLAGQVAEEQGHHRDGGTGGGDDGAPTGAGSLKS